MPELPDLCVYSQNLKKRILDKKIASVVIGNPYKINSPEAFGSKLTGTSIEDIIREGKELRFLLANKNSFNIHLMQSGMFYVCDQNEAELIKHKIITICFEDSLVFITADCRRQCRITLNPGEVKVPDALSDKFTIKYFSSVAKTNAFKNVKSVLTDQNIVRGIGNAYADEILWKADISPESNIGKIPEEKLHDLFEAIPIVLNDAIQMIQKIAPDIINGEERSFFKVHIPRREFSENGDKIIVKEIAAKRTYFTDKQKLYR